MWFGDKQQPNMTGLTMSAFQNKSITHVFLLALVMLQTGPKKSSLRRVLTANN